MSTSKDDPRDSSLEAPYTMPNTWYKDTSGTYVSELLSPLSDQPPNLFVFRWSRNVWHVSFRPYYGYPQPVHNLCVADMTSDS